MNSKAEIIAGSSLPVYPQHKSRFFGSVSKKLRLVFAFYSPDGNEIAMPIPSMTAYLSAIFPGRSVARACLDFKDSEKYSPSNYAKAVQSLEPDLIAFSIMSPHWYPMEPYFDELKQIMPELPICIRSCQAMLSQEQTLKTLT